MARAGRGPVRKGKAVQDAEWRAFEQINFSSSHEEAMGWQGEKKFFSWGAERGLKMY
jgi:hypothetical protein